MAAAEKVMTGVTTIEEVFRVHWCQLNVKPIARLGMNSQSNSGSCLLMTKEPENCLVNFSLLWLLAQKFISGRVWKPTNKLSVA